MPLIAHETAQLGLLCHLFHRAGAPSAAWFSSHPSRESAGGQHGHWPYLWIQGPVCMQEG